jgi:hypothetical protein
MPFALDLVHDPRMHTTDRAAARGHLASDEQGRLVQNGAGRARSVRISRSPKPEANTVTETDADTITYNDLKGLARFGLASPS